MWEAIKPLCPHTHPTHLLIDFEKAVANVFTDIWPHTRIKRCLFHLTQNIFRKIQAEGLQNESFAIQIDLSPALAFAPPSNVLNFFAGVVQDLPMPMAEGTYYFLSLKYYIKKSYGFFLPTVYLLLYFFLHFSFSFTYSLLIFTCYLFFDQHSFGVE